MYVEINCKLTVNEEGDIRVFHEITEGFDDNKMYAIPHDLHADPKASAELLRGFPAWIVERYRTEAENAISKIKLPGRKK